MGSLARRELGPRSDVDLVLLHDGRRSEATTALAERLWYPLWDARVRLDHAVRTPAECAEVAGRELSAGVGLLDLRLVAGDAELVARARTGLLDSWRRHARRRLPELLESLDDRWRSSGDAAYLLEPDLKEARGGFRDLAMLRALAATWLTDRPHGTLDQPAALLLDVRDALHVTSGRPLDRLVAAEAPEVAGLLGYADADAVSRAVSLAARRIGHAVDLTVRAARGALPQQRRRVGAPRRRGPAYAIAPHGLIVVGDEVGLARDTSPATPLLDLRAGALAASRGLVLSPVSADHLGALCPPPPIPWPAAAREAFVELLSAGEALIAVWEALDLAGCVARWIPPWLSISVLPQHNQVHRHTVDRHSVQTVVEAQPHLTRVERPDLLLLACLFQDLGKGTGAGSEHPEAGALPARAAVEAMGLGPADADVVERLVRHHLTLADLATRRDHADPATVDALIGAVDGRTEVLRLLTALTEADARAAGPLAWSPWRRRLITALAGRVEGQLIGEPRREVAVTEADLALARPVADDGRPRVALTDTGDEVQLVVAARDRDGLFSDTAGLLAAHRVSVRSAVLSTVGTVAVVTWRIDQQPIADLPGPPLLVQQLERLERGDAGVLTPVIRREARAFSTAALPQPHVEVLPGASVSATVIEVRTSDRPGLLYALGQALTATGVSIRSAHISTVAGQAIDTFYVTESTRDPLSRARGQQAVRALLQAAGQPAG